MICLIDRCLATAMLHHGQHDSGAVAARLALLRKSATFALALVVGAFLVLLAAQARAEAPPPPERATWRGMPIEVVLAPGEERAIRVKGARGLRAGLIGGPVPGLRVQPLGDRVFVTASESFRSTRMLLRTAGGDTLMLDLRKDDGAGSLPPLEISLPGRPAPTAGVQAATGATLPPEPPRRDGKETTVGYQRLVRHAARSLYAPPRLAPADPAVARVPLRGAAPTEGLIRGACCVARPVAAWRAQGRRGEMWLTAVEVRNRLTEPVEIDPRVGIRGRWLAVSAQFWRMGAAGTDSEVTTLYLISDRPWRRAIGAIASATIDPALDVSSEHETEGETAP